MSESLDWVKTPHSTNKNKNKTNMMEVWIRVIRRKESFWNFCWLYNKLTCFSQNELHCYYFSRHRDGCNSEIFHRSLARAYFFFFPLQKLPRIVLYWICTAIVLGGKHHVSMIWFIYIYIYVNMIFTEWFSFLAFEHNLL